MKVKKRLLAAISSLLLAASACVPLSASADSALLSTDKAAYTEGEAIMITAAGTGNDWVGIYKNGETPGAAIQSIRWYYVAKDGNTSGKAKNIFESEYTVRQDLKNLPAAKRTAAHSFRCILPCGVQNRMCTLNRCLHAGHTTVCVPRFIGRRSCA